MDVSSSPSAAHFVQSVRSFVSRKISDTRHHHLGLGQELSFLVAQATRQFRPATRRTELEQRFELMGRPFLKVAVRSSGRRVADRGGRVARVTCFSNTLSERRSRNGRLAASQARAPPNPNGIASPSPRLACNACLGCTFGNETNANGVVAKANRVRGTDEPQPRCGWMVC